MKQIERFNHQLNNRDYFIDELAKEYYEHVESILKGAIVRLKEKNKMIVIGAGNLSDISLELLLHFFSDIVLSDIDVSSTLDALKTMKLPDELNRKIRIERIEYTGFEEYTFFEYFKERIVTSKSKDSIKQVFDQKLSEIKQYAFLQNDNEFDLVLVSPIYTQLVYYQVSAECEVLRSTGYNQELIEYIKEYMLNEMVHVIDRFNQQLIKKLNNDGNIVVLSDIFQLQNDSDFYRRVKNGIKNDVVMEELYEGYKKKYGMGLGDYGLYNLDGYLRSTLSRWLIWPFDKDSSLIIKLKIYSK